MTVTRLVDGQKVTMNLTRSTVERLKILYPSSGYQAAIRMILDAHVAGIEAKRVRMIEELVPEIEIEEIE